MFQINVKENVRKITYKNTSFYENKRLLLLTQAVMLMSYFYLWLET